MATALMERPVAKKKTPKADPPEPKRYGTMIRVSDEFAEALRKVCALSGKSAAEYAMDRLLKVVLDDYDDLLAKEAKAAQERRK